MAPHTSAPQLLRAEKYSREDARINGGTGWRGENAFSKAQRVNNSIYHKRDELVCQCVSVPVCQCASVPVCQGASVPASSVSGGSFYVSQQTREAGDGDVDGSSGLARLKQSCPFARGCNSWCGGQATKTRQRRSLTTTCCCVSCLPPPCLLHRAVRLTQCCCHCCHIADNLWNEA